MWRTTVVLLDWKSGGQKTRTFETLWHWTAYMVTFVHVGASIVVGKRQSGYVRRGGGEELLKNHKKNVWTWPIFWGKNTRSRLLFWSFHNYEQQVAYERFLVLLKQIIGASVFGCRMDYRLSSTLRKYNIYSRCDIFLQANRVTIYLHVYTKAELFYIFLRRGEILKLRPIIVQEWNTIFYNFIRLRPLKF